MSNSLFPKLESHSYRVGIFLATCSFFLFTNFIHADVGGDNPTGTSGQFNGNVTTGCSYDPYTANATRSVTDIVVAGGVSTYPLAFTRTMNSRYTLGAFNWDFGQAGSWKHSFQWNINSVTTSSHTGVTRPTSYTVNYPDGRRVIFTLRSGDSDFRGVAGVRDRFESLAAGATECYLRLPDGGKVWFHADIQTDVEDNGCDCATGLTYTTTYTFSLKGIIDPYGQTTMVTYPADGSMTITEPAGRWLKLFYIQTPWTNGGVHDTVVGSVQASDGRSIQYNYGQMATPNGTTYTFLGNIAYFGDPTLVAIYAYQNGNTDPNGRPLIRSCIDTMYDGPMFSIGYTFVPNGTGVVYGQLQSENYCNPTTNLVGAAVSTLTVTGTSTRKETRGDNPTGAGNPVRTFTYTGYLLTSTTDFKGTSGTQGYDPNSFVNAVRDRNGIITTFQTSSLTGNIIQVGYPLTPGDTLPGTPQMVITYVYGNHGTDDPNNNDDNNPYYLYSLKGGSTKVNKYWRDSNKRVITIFYVDGNTENFTYNFFGQVLTHKLRNGYTESYTYDGAGRVLTYRDAAHATGNPTAWYQYDSLGRVWKMTEARGSAVGDPNYTTTFEYNQRGQLTKLTHPDGTYVQSGYGNIGTLIWTADERHPGGATDATQRTGYTYDSYKRLRTVITPLRAAGDQTSRTTTYFYDQAASGEDVTHTTPNLTKVVSPGNKSVTASYDENLRTVSVTATGDSNVANGTTTYTYDPVGNLTTTKEPNGQISGAFTKNYYDQQNRISAIDDPIAANRNSDGHTISFTYDVAGNKIQEKRADNLICKYQYDPMGRLSQQTDDANYITGYTYDAAGNLTKMTDPNLHGYSFTYDQLDRRTAITYPLDFAGVQRSERWVYDIGNYLFQYVNPAGQTKTLTHDNRGRLTGTFWSANGPTIAVVYDASRPTNITTSAYTVGGITSPATTITFGYDEANNRTYEDQTVIGLSTRRVQTDLDADGNRKNLLVKTGATINFANYFDYTSRNELLNIYDSSSAPFFKYTYDPSGNVTQRVGQRLHDTTALQYDALNRPILCSQSGLNGANFATSHYDYEKLGNLQDTYRDEEGGKGERFTYDGINQLKTAVYSALNVTTTNPTNPAKSVSYALNSNSRTSMTVTDNVLQTTITTNYTSSDLNQFTVIGGQSVQYDNNLNRSQYSGLTYTYDAESRLIYVNGNGHTAQFAYDPAGRCVQRTLDGVTSVLTYDQWTPIVEWDGSGNLVATNVYGLGEDEILYRSSGATQLFYKSDPMGNVRFLLSNTGVGVEKYTYDAFGLAKITDWSGNARTVSAYGNRFMFGGREYLQTIGFYDLRNRIYDPVTGSFLQVDPIGFEGDPSNLYRFCGNNPLLGGDNMGFDWLDDIGDFFSNIGYAFSHTSFNFGGGGDHSPDGSSDAAVWASANWWGDDVNIGYPVGYLSDPTSTGPNLTSFGSVFTPISQFQPKGQFTIWAKPSKFNSGTDFTIIFVCPTCPQNMGLRLDQDIRGLVPVFNEKGIAVNFTNRPTFGADFVNGSALHNQRSEPNKVTALDEAGMWDQRGRSPGSAIPVRTGVSNFEPFFQEMTTAAFGKYDGTEVLLGVIKWRADYSPGNVPHYSGIGTHSAMAPDPGSRFHQ